MSMRERKILWLDASVEVRARVAAFVVLLWAGLLFPGSSAFIPIINSVFITRGLFIKHATSAVSVVTASFSNVIHSTNALDTNGNIIMDLDKSAEMDVAYRSLAVAVLGTDQSTLEKVEIDVPVAMWYPVDRTAEMNNHPEVKYSHSISLAKVTQLVAGWKFIPKKWKRDFSLGSTFSVVDGTSTATPSQGPVVLLAHGYLGSRFDLSHLGEFLASQGYICISPEYPESLAASYPIIEGLSRSVITSNVLLALEHKWNIKGTKFATVGHSLGCGTAMMTGDRNWVRICLAGPPVERDSRSAGGAILSIGSVNDGVISLDRIRSTTFENFVEVRSDSPLFSSCPVDKDEEKWAKIPRRTAMIFQNSDDAPNHISFLAENVCDSMIQTFSMLLPLAQVLGVSLLDFDKYNKSRDSDRTAKVVLPVVNEYLRQHML